MNDLQDPLGKPCREQGCEHLGHCPVFVSVRSPMPLNSFLGESPPPHTHTPQIGNQDGAGVEGAVFPYTWFLRMCDWVPVASPSCIQLKHIFRDISPKLTCNLASVPFLALGKCSQTSLMISIPLGHLLKL